MHIAKDIAPRMPHMEKYNKVDTVHCSRPQQRKHPPKLNTTNTRLATHVSKIKHDTVNRDVWYVCKARPIVKYTYASTISDTFSTVVMTMSGGRTKEPYVNKPTIPEMPTNSHNAYTISDTMKCIGADAILMRRTTWAHTNPTKHDKHMKATEMPTARTGTQRFNCWWFTDIVANKRTKTTEIASFMTASFSITSAINVSSRVRDNINVATVSVGANNDAINKASTKVMCTSNNHVQVNIPHAISTMDINVPIQANTIEESQVRRKDSGRNRNDEFSNITGNSKYKNNSGANTNGAPPEPDQNATNIPNNTATTEFGIQRTRSIVSQTTIHNNNINKTIISVTAISCSICYDSNSSNIYMARRSP